MGFSQSKTSTFTGQHRNNYEPVLDSDPQLKFVGGLWNWKNRSRYNEDNSDGVDVFTTIMAVFWVETRRFGGSHHLHLRAEE
jgi:hypothetical protein